MLKVMRSFISILLSAGLVFMFVPSAWAESNSTSNPIGEASSSQQPLGDLEGSDDLNGEESQQDSPQGQVSGQQDPLQEQVPAQQNQEAELGSPVSVPYGGSQAATYLPEGAYCITSALSGSLALAVPGSSKANGANVQLASYSASASQQWAVAYDADGYATFTNVSSGKVLDVAAARTAYGTNVQQYTSNGSLAQKWTLVQVDKGYVIVSALDDSIVLDVASGKAKNGANVQIYGSNDTDAQVWKFVSIDETYAKLDARADAARNLLTDGDVCFIETALSKNKVLDIAGASMNNAANAQIYELNFTAAQKFLISHDEKGYVTFTNVGSGKVLDISGGSAKSGANVQQYASNDTRAQKWIVEESPSGEGYTISSALWPGLSLDVSGAKTANGTNAQSYASNGSIAQVWNFISERQAHADLDARASSSRGLLEDGTYVISSCLDQIKVLDVSGKSTMNGANVQLWESVMGSNQHWQVSHDEKGYVTFTNVGSGKVLDISGGSAKSGANVQQYASNDTRAQKWIVEESPSGEGYTISSALWPGLSLDVSAGKPKDGANVQSYASNGTAAQAFVFFDTEPVVEPSQRLPELEDAYYRIMPAANSAYCFDILKGSESSGANLQIYAANGSYAQLFRFAFVSDDSSESGYYQIICCCSDMAIAVDKGNVVNGANALQVPANTQDDSQLFSVRLGNDGSLVFVNKASGLALDVLNGSVSSGANVQGYTPNGSSAQSFTLEEVVDLLPRGYMTISSKLNASMVVDVSGGSLSAGANVQLYKNNDTLAQKWLVASLGEGSNTYTLQSINSGMNLSVEESGNVVQKPADGTDGQKWQPEISKGATLLRNVGTGQVLAVENASASNGANIRVDDQNGSASQLFVFDATDLIAKSTYYIAPVASESTPLDVVSGSTADGAKVQIYKKNDTGAQKWKVSRNSDGTYSIKNAKSGKALELNGSEIQMRSANGALAQKWIFTYCVGGGIKITSAANPDIALTVDGSGFASGSSVVGAAFADLDSQKFMFSKTLYVPSNVQSNFRDMYTKAHDYSSNTDWLIMVDKNRCILGVFQGNRDDWTMVKQLSCAVGKPFTPTPSGISTTTHRYFYHSQSYYRTVFWFGQYGIHSVINSDSELGKKTSNGCVRINRNEAIWVFNNIPLGTTVVVY